MPNIVFSNTRSVITIWFRCIPIVLVWCGYLCPIFLWIELACSCMDETVVYASIYCIFYASIYCMFYVSIYCIFYASIYSIFYSSIYCIFCSFEMAPCVFALKLFLRALLWPLASFTYYASMIGISKRLCFAIAMFHY